MKVLHVVHSIQEKASGPSQSIPALCGAVSEQGVDLELHVCEGQKPAGAKYEFVRHGCLKWTPRVGISPVLHRALKQEAATTDIYHTHGMWNMAHIYPGWVASENNKLLVITPRGTTGKSPGSRSRIKKGIVWNLWQKRVLLGASCINATSEMECEDVRQSGYRGPIALIPNGVDLVDLPSKSASKDDRIMRRLLYLSRITPIKNLPNLLNAWKSVQNQFTNWELHITGIDDRGHEGEMKNLAKKLGLQRIVFTGPVYGDDRTQAYLDADLFVLPTQSENFGMAVAEALAHELPAIVTKGAPWSGLQEHDCGWWIDIGVQPMVDILQQALAESPQSLREKGKKGRQWMERDFSWNSVAEKMVKTYEWLLIGGEKPDWVRLD